jgi:hypothetical protein
MFDGNLNSHRTIDTETPLDDIQYPLSDETYRRLKQEALKKILGSAPKYIRRAVESGAW